MLIPCLKKIIWKQGSKKKKCQTVIYAHEKNTESCKHWNYQILSGTFNEKILQIHIH